MVFRELVGMADTSAAPDGLPVSQALHHCRHCSANSMIEPGYSGPFGAAFRAESPFSSETLGDVDTPACSCHGSVPKRGS